MEKNSNLRRNLLALCEGAVLIALAEILSFLPLFKFPWGGSVDLAMLPALIFCMRWGFGPGAIACCAHAIMQGLFSSSAGFIGWQSFLGDYFIAYSVLMLAGLFKGKFYLGASVAMAARFLVHYVVGATIWAEYMPEQFFGMTMTTPWIYSALYNGAYMVLDFVVVVAAYFLLTKTPVVRYLKGENMK